MYKGERPGVVVTVCTCTCLVLRCLESVLHFVAGDFCYYLLKINRLQIYTLNDNLMITLVLKGKVLGRLKHSDGKKKI